MNKLTEILIAFSASLFTVIFIGFISILNDVPKEKESLWLLVTSIIGMIAILCLKMAFKSTK